MAALEDEIDDRRIIGIRGFRFPHVFAPRDRIDSQHDVHEPVGIVRRGAEAFENEAAEYGFFAHGNRIGGGVVGKDGSRLAGGDVLDREDLRPVRLVRRFGIEPEIGGAAPRVGDPYEDAGRTSGIGEHHEIVSCGHVHDGHERVGIADGIEFRNRIGERRIRLRLGFFDGEGIDGLYRDADGSRQKNGRNGYGHHDFHERESFSKHGNGAGNAKFPGMVYELRPFSRKRGRRGKTGLAEIAGRSILEQIKLTPYEQPHRILPDQ